MKDKIEKFFWLEEGELDFVELFEATLGVVALMVMVFLPLYMSGGAGI